MMLARRENHNDACMKAKRNLFTSDA